MKSIRGVASLKSVGRTWQGALLFCAIALLSACNVGGVAGGSSLNMLGQLAFSSTPANFGAVAPGSTTTITLTLSNSGSEPLSLKILTDSALGLSAPFSLGNGGTCTTGTVLASAASCTLSISFAPTVVGVASQTAQFSYDSNGSSLNAALVILGTGQPPGQITYSDGATYDFGSVNEYSGATHTETLTNTGGLALSLGTLSSASLGLSGPYLLNGGTCATGQSLAVGASCTLVFDFAPLAAGAIRAQAVSLSYQSNGSTFSAGITLQGAGIPIGNLALSSAPSYSFGRVFDGSSASNTFTATNTGGQALVLGTVSAAALGLSSPYAISGGTCASGATLAAAASCTLTVGYAPLIMGTYAQTLTFNYQTASQSESTSIAINGTSVDFIPLSNGQAAGMVLGQPDFTQSATATTQTGMHLPWGVGIGTNGALYVNDYGNERILGFNAIPANGSALNPPADFVLGAPDFITAGSNNDIIPYYYAAAAANALAVEVYPNASTGGYQVNLYQPLPTSETVFDARGVILGDGAATCTRNSLQSNYPVMIAGGKLLVSDHNRLLIWNTLPTVSGTQPDLVIGQPNFTTCTTAASATASVTGSIYGAWTDGVKLVVADGLFNRVLIWNTFPTVSGQAADVVLGQPDMLSSAVNNTPSAPGTVSAQSFYYPTDVTSNGFQLFIGDSNNNRILVWNSFPTSNQQAADVVLGQAGFGTSTQSLGGATGLNGGTCGLAIFKGQSLVADDCFNNRVLIWYGQ